MEKTVLVLGCHSSWGPAENTGLHGVMRGGQARSGWSRTSAIPQPFCVQWGARVSPLLKCFPSGWNPALATWRRKLKGPTFQRQG